MHMHTHTHTLHTHTHTHTYTHTHMVNDKYDLIVIGGGAGHYDKV